MRYIFRFFLMLAILAAITVIGFAYVGDLSPQRSPVETPITLEVH